MIDDQLVIIHIMNRPQARRRTVFLTPMLQVKDISVHGILSH